MEEEERLAEKAKVDLFLQYLAMNFAQLPQGKESAERRMERDKFLNHLQPKDMKKKEYKWGNPELDAAMALIEQEGGESNGD